MSTHEVVEIDTSTGEIIRRDATPDEATQYATDMAAVDAAANVQVAAIAALAVTNQKLLNLGLTQTDISNLLNAAKG